MIPVDRTDCASSSRAVSSNRVRGWYGLGSSRSISTCSGPPDSAGATAAEDCVVVGIVTGGAASGSRIRAPSPLPNAFLATGDYLLCKVDVSFSASTMNVVKMNRLSVAWRLGQANISRDYSLKHLSAEEASQIGGDLPRKSGPFVIHRKHEPLDRQGRV